MDGRGDAGPAGPHVRETLLDPKEAAQEAYERHLLDADWMTLQIVQTALALIGFGFTLHAFFMEAGDDGALGRPDVYARRVGLSLLVIGIILLASGILHQGGYRTRLLRRWAPVIGDAGATRLQSRFTPSYVAAILLLAAGLLALASIVWRSLG